MRHFRHLVKPYILWSFAMIVIPLGMIVLYAFAGSGNAVLTFNFTLENLAKFIEPTYLSVFWKSIRLGFITTGICLVMGYALAYVISKMNEQVQDLMILLVTVPMWINMLLRTYAWMNLLSDNGIVNAIFGLLGIEPISMMYTDFSVVIGMVCNFLPFMIIPIHTSLHKMDKSLIEAAYDLGANRIQTFYKVIFKLSLPGVLNGFVMVFLMAISTFVIPKLLGGGQYVLIGNLIETQFVTVGDWNFGSAISLILAVIIILFMRVMKKIDPQEDKEG